jgi:hypothetical protein
MKTDFMITRITACFLLILIVSCGRQQTFEIGNGYYKFSEGGIAFAAMTDFQFKKSGYSLTADIKQIGPIAIVPDIPNTDLVGAFKRMKDGGVWETRFGDLQPGSVYYVEINHAPILLGSIPAKYGNSTTVTGDKSLQEAGAELLSDLLDASKSDLLLRERLMKATKQVRVNP